jgi:hypothetical protein
MMKKTLFLIPLLAVFVVGLVRAEDFLGAPVVPDAEVLEKTKTRLEVQASGTHKEVLRFYREQLKDQPDIKFRDWKDATYIEDDGKLSWHSITISKEGQNGTNVVILKDNWTWIIGTLLLRFIGVFVVLMILFLFMALTGRFLSKFFQETDKGSPSP